MTEAELSQSGAGASESLAFALDEPGYASFWRRAAAAVIDGVIVGIPLAVGTYFLYPDHIFTLSQNPEAPPLAYLLFLAVYVLAVIAYMSGLESGPRQATVGKQLLGITVTDLEMRRVSFMRAFRRGWFYWLPLALILIDSVAQVMVFALISMIVALVSCATAAFSERRQALHDISSGCLMIERSATNDRG